MDSSSNDRPRNAGAKMAWMPLHRKDVASALIVALVIGVIYVFGNSQAPTATDAARARHDADRKAYTQARDSAYRAAYQQAYASSKKASVLTGRQQGTAAGTRAGAKRGRLAGTAKGKAAA